LRIAAGLVCAAVFFAALYYVTLAESSVSCTVCLDFGGGQSCKTVAAPDREQAIAQAMSTACASLSAGVTQGMSCMRTRPRSTTCTE
jgi:hypothetical protein